MKYLRPLLPITLGFQSTQEEQTFAFLHTKPKQLFQSSDQLHVLKVTPVGDLTDAGIPQRPEVLGRIISGRVVTAARSRSCVPSAEGFHRLKLL